MMQPGDFLLRYTLCFLTRGEQVLMLLRDRPPNQGLWNGVGGRIEPGEAPIEACLREVREETGYRLTALHFAGLLTWKGFARPEEPATNFSGGLYIFTAEAPPGEPAACDEGRLEWKLRTWMFSSPEVVSNIHVFGPLILDGAAAQVYHFDYRGGEIQGHRIFPLPWWVTAGQGSGR